MNVTCPHCNIKLNLPDNKLPMDRDASFKCPKCKGIIQVKASQALSSQGSADQALEHEHGDGAYSNGIDNAPDLPLYRRGKTLRAMVCMPSSPARDKLCASIRRLRFRIDLPKSPIHAFECLEYHTYPLVVLDETFDPDRRVRIFMDDMDISLRRKSCLVLINAGVETGNPMAALHASVNCIVNPRDIEQEDDLYLEDTLNAALADHKKFYAVYRHALKDAGKV